VNVIWYAKNQARFNDKLLIHWRSCIPIIISEISFLGNFTCNASDQVSMTELKRAVMAFNNHSMVPWKLMNRWLKCINLTRSMSFIASIFSGRGINMLIP
jgi:hypothetical protein